MYYPRNGSAFAGYRRAFTAAGAAPISSRFGSCEANTIQKTLLSIRFHGAKSEAARRSIDRISSPDSAHRAMITIIDIATPDAEIGQASSNRYYGLFAGSSFHQWQYWGLINLRERYDDDYLQMHYGIDRRMRLFIRRNGRSEYRRIE